MTVTVTDTLAVDTAGHNLGILVDHSLDCTEDSSDIGDSLHILVAVVGRSIALRTVRIAGLDCTLHTAGIGRPVERVVHLAGSCLRLAEKHLLVDCLGSCVVASAGLSLYLVRPGRLPKNLDPPSWQKFI